MPECENNPRLSKCGNLEQVGSETLSELRKPSHHYHSGENIQSLDLIRNAWLDLKKAEEDIAISGFINYKAKLNVMLWVLRDQFEEERSLPKVF